MQFNIEVAPVLTSGSSFVKSTNFTLNNKTNYIIIGEEEYQGMPKLEYADRDAVMFTKLLMDRTGPKNENIHLLMNKTRDQLLSSLKDIAKTLDPNDNVVFYYSGHSNLSETDGLQILPLDSKTESYDLEGISIAQIYSYFVTNGYFLTLFDSSMSPPEKG